MYKITKEFKFAAAHRIEGHPKCKRLHGHNYKVIVELEGNVLPVDGMLLDYGILKELVAPIIDALDHRYMYGKMNVLNDDELTAREDAIELPVHNTTAEELARYLFKAIGTAVSKWVSERSAGEWIGVEVSSVTVKETDSTTAVYP